MKKFLIVVMLLIPTLAYPTQRNKPVFCHQLNEILDNLKTNYGEKLEFVVENQIYRDFITNIAMMRNKETGSWTMIEYGENFDGEGCVIASGKDHDS